MLIRNPYREIGSIYSGILNESPDNIKINDQYFDYADTPGAYTGLIGENGKYVLSSKIIGHSNLISHILNPPEPETVMEKIISNMDDINAIKEVVRGRTKIRIWSEQKVYSFWERYDPKYEKAIKNSIKAIGGNYKEYKYDLLGMKYDEMPTYKEFFVKQLTDEEKAEIEEKQAKQRQAERALADLKSGARRPVMPSSDYDNTPTRTPSWQKRDGD